MINRVISEFDRVIFLLKSSLSSPNITADWIVIYNIILTSNPK